MNEDRFYDRTLAFTVVCLAFVVALILGACSPAAAAPPVVQPTPQVIEVTPPACRDLIAVLNEAAGDRNQVLLDIYSAYLDYPDENLLDFGRRVEAIMDKADIAPIPDNYQSLVDECIGSPGAGAES